MDLDKILKSKVSCIIIPGDKFNEELIKLLKKVKNKKVCYVTLNKGADVLIESLNKNKINPKNFFFIDCVSKTIVQPKPIENCQFISSPNALTELSLAIDKSIDSGFSIVLVDSLSTFMIYHNAEMIIQFFHNLANKIRSEDGNILILTISDKDKDSEVFKKMEIIVDKIIETS
jgi:archaellum biogenesis ATPase FlaH